MKITYLVCATILGLAMAVPAAEGTDNVAEPIVVEGLETAAVMTVIVEIGTTIIGDVDTVIVGEENAGALVGRMMTIDRGRVME
ncbi:hypothetical protein BDW42DRAFT_114222 [Aspergillus taichungensis]|uniref:Uncharacterized protein n=1 Tax=Aspergillus taichungensis TaxID=482145 RepID=A0A2J5HTC9_9EURO|nr:hypothetical protein BDW42DRAFT_114222 [Aspergillus taichungensis]